MKTTIAIMLLLLASSAFAGNWESSPSNWKNSSSNWDNSSSNWKNSPSNFNNSSSNYNSNNGTYDTSGNRTGYAVQRSDGGTNFFSSNGHRVGYVPSDNN